jgi:hypothetical protein
LKLLLFIKLQKGFLSKSSRFGPDPPPFLLRPGPSSSFCCRRFAFAPARFPAATHPAAFKPSFPRRMLVTGGVRVRVNTGLTTPNFAALLTTTNTLRAERMQAIPAVMPS